MSKKRKNSNFAVGSVIFIIILAASIIGIYWKYRSPIILAILGIAIIYLLKFKNTKNKNIDFDTMGGHEFEYFCSELLKSNGFNRVTVTQGSADHGIDILANFKGVRYAIQCKRYKKNVGNRAIQEAFSGKAIYRADVAVVLTNSYFTKQAKNDALILNVQLWDRDKLLKFIRKSGRM
ncbi:MAG: restriction endonuclease [Lachnospiraceae bacterium]|nr:restriction endonuclease [Lachnospiraceae bacterium]